MWIVTLEDDIRQEEVPEIKISCGNQSGSLATHLARPCCSASASFSGILAGEFAKSLTSCQYVLAKRKMNTTLTSRKRKYLDLT